MATPPPVVAVANLKGGVGKSTTALMLAEGLAYFYGLRVLLYDFDAQANLSETLLTSNGVRRALNQGGGVPAILDTFIPGGESRLDSDSPLIEERGATVIEELVQARDRLEDDGWVSLLPAHPGMRFLEPHLERSPGDGWFEIGDQLGRIIQESTAEARAGSDLVLIDCPPHISALCRTGLKLADYYVTPTLAEVLSIWGVHQFLNWLVHPSMCEWIGHDRDTVPERQFVVCTRYAPRSRAHQRALGQLRADWRDRAFSDPIRQRLSLSRELERDDENSLHHFAGRYRGHVKGDIRRLSESFAGFMKSRHGTNWERKR